MDLQDGTTLGGDVIQSFEVNISRGTDQDPVSEPVQWLRWRGLRVFSRMMPISSSDLGSNESISTHGSGKVGMKIGPLERCRQSQSGKGDVQNMVLSWWYFLRPHADSMQSH